MRIARFDGTADSWDRFVRSQSNWTHFHLHGWRTVMERVFDHECPYLVAQDDEGITGVLPLVRVRSRIFGHFLVSMPFVNYGGPLGSSETQRALLKQAAERAASDGVGLFQVRSRHELPTDLAVGHQKLTVLIDIPEGGGEGLWKQLPQKMRTKVRKPQKEGVEVRFGRDQLDAFFDVFAENMRDLGTPVLPRKFFEEIADVFGDSVWFAAAYLRGEAVSGGCGFVWGKEMEITWSSSRRSSTGVRPGYLLHWAMMEKAANEGCRVANFGRSTPNSGTHEYKKQWDGREEVQWWYYQSADGRASTPSPDDGKFSWGPRIWQKLPVGLATRLGPMVVRFIP